TRRKVAHPLHEMSDAIAEPGEHERHAVRAATRHGPSLATAGGMSDSNNAEHVDFTSLAQLRDEIRVRLHLARLDAKEEWQKLETRFSSLEHRLTADGG